MKLWRLRRELYRGARRLGDVQAVAHGPQAIVKRPERQWVGRLLGRFLRRM
jgi:hypothetical protein